MVLRTSAKHGSGLFICSQDSYRIKHFNTPQKHNITTSQNGLLEKLWRSLATIQLLPYLECLQGTVCQPGSIFPTQSLHRIATRQIDSWIERQTDRQIDVQIDRQIDCQIKQIYRQIVRYNRQMDKQLCKYIDIFVLVSIILL